MLSEGKTSWEDKCGQCGYYLSADFFEFYRKTGIFLKISDLSYLQGFRACPDFVPRPEGIKP